MDASARVPQQSSRTQLRKSNAGPRHAAHLDRTVPRPMATVPAPGEQRIFKSARYPRLRNLRTAPNEAAHLNASAPTLRNDRNRHRALRITQGKGLEAIAHQQQPVPTMRNDRIRFRGLARTAHLSTTRSRSNCARVATGTDDLRSYLDSNSRYRDHITKIFKAWTTPTTRNCAVNGQTGLCAHQKQYISTGL